MHEKTQNIGLDLFIYLFIKFQYQQKLIGGLHPILIEYNLQLGDLPFQCKISPKTQKEEEEEEEEEEDHVSSTKPTLSFQIYSIAYVQQ
jgi:hypothetical protein